MTWLVWDECTYEPMKWKWMRSHWKDLQYTSILCIWYTCIYTSDNSQDKWGWSYNVCFKYNINHLQTWTISQSDFWSMIYCSLYFLLAYNECLMKNSLCFDWIWSVQWVSFIWIWPPLVIWHLCKMNKNAKCKVRYYYNMISYEMA